MANIGARVKARREQLGWSQMKLATVAGIDRGFLARIEKGTSGFSEKTITKIAGALGLSVGALYAAGSNVTMAPADIRSIPVLDYVQAGQWRAVREGNVDGGFREFIGTNIDCAPSTFALRIRGDSMEPRFTAGDIVMIDPTIRPQPGDFVVAVDEDGEATFKQFRSVGVDKRGHEIFELLPLNTLYRPLRSDQQQIAIVGTMIEHRIYRRR
jgi:SOS-response transcriptional repressor LexA